MIGDGRFLVGFENIWLIKGLETNGWFGCMVGLKFGLVMIGLLGIVLIDGFNTDIIGCLGG